VVVATVVVPLVTVTVAPFPPVSLIVELDFIELREVADQVLSPITTTYDGNPEFIHDEKLSP
jgi:hypothetical protein